MSFSINTITTAGAALMASATTTDKLQISGCDLYESELTLQEAQALASYSPTGLIQSILRSYISTDSRIQVEAKMSGISGEYMAKSAVLYGKLASQSEYTVIAVCSSSSYYRIPSSSSVISDFAIVFSIQYSISSNVVSVTDSALSVSQAQFSGLEAQMLGVGNADSQGIGFIGNRSGIPVYDSFVAAQCYAKDGDSFRIKDCKSQFLFSYKRPPITCFTGRTLTFAKTFLADIKDNLVMLAFVLNNGDVSSPSDYHFMIAVYDMKKSVKKKDGTMGAAVSDIYELGDPFVYSPLDNVAVNNLQDVNFGYEMPHFLYLSGLPFVMCQNIASNAQWASDTTRIFENPDFGQSFTSSSGYVDSTSSTGFMSVYTQQAGTASFNQGFWYDWDYDIGNGTQSEPRKRGLVFLCENFALNFINNYIDMSVTSSYSNNVGQICRIHIRKNASQYERKIYVDNAWLYTKETMYPSGTGEHAPYPAWEDAAPLFSSKKSVPEGLTVGQYSYINNIIRSVLKDGTRVVVVNTVCEYASVVPSEYSVYPLVFAFCKELFTDEFEDLNGSDIPPGQAADNDLRTIYSAFSCYPDNIRDVPGTGYSIQNGTPAISSFFYQPAWYAYYVSQQIIYANDSGLFISKGADTSNLTRFFSCASDLFSPGYEIQIYPSSFPEPSVEATMKKIGYASNGSIVGFYTTVSAGEPPYQTTVTYVKVFDKVFYLPTSFSSVNSLAIPVFNAQCSGVLSGLHTIYALDNINDEYNSTDSTILEGDEKGYVNILLLSPEQHPVTYSDNNNYLPTFGSTQIYTKHFGKL